jgi:dipeptidyl aminopeptidase/acylaminoacyl peptidase
VAEGIQDADWAPDGQRLLVVRDVGGKARIEFPMGKVLYETSGHVSYARLSPRADRIAFLDHPFPADDAGTVAVIDLEGRKTTLSGRWASEHGLAWTPSGNEVWFTATEAGANRSLYAVSLQGKIRVVARVPGGLKLHDVAPNGRVLLTRESPRVGPRGRSAPSRPRRGSRTAAGSSSRGASRAIACASMSWASTVEPPDPSVRKGSRPLSRGSPSRPTASSWLRSAPTRGGCSSPPTAERRG